MNDFDRALESIRKNVPPVGDAADRVRENLAQAAREGSLCSSFRADFGALRAGTLSDARRMLLEDHLHTCAMCRREYAGVETAKVVEMPRRAWTRRWAVAAVAAALTVGVGLATPSVLNVVLTPSGPRATVASIDGTLVAISAEGAQALAVGAAIEEGQQIRTGKESHAMIRLRDGSLVEMRERSELNIEEKWRSKTIHLERGSVIVEAAKQHDGRLEVATADALVTVHGTIFGVSMGLPGSRVSVVEGVVQVDETGAGTSILKRGDQKTTNAMERTAVTDDISWSQNAAKYITLLEDLRNVGDQISRIPMPGLRYNSRLIDRLPVGTAFVAAMPNLTNMIDEAQRIFDNRAAQSPVLAEWWSKSGERGMRDALDHIRTLGSYFGDEVIAAFPVMNAGPIVLAEIRNGSEADLRAELAKQGYTGPVSFDGSIVAIGANAVPPVGPFTTTAFGSQIAAKYSTGAGILWAANVEQFPISHVSTDIPPSPIGFENLRTVIAEHKGSLRDPVQTAEFAFNGERKGLASWLTEPGPMGSLEFFSRDASFAAAAVTRDPREFITEMMRVNGHNQEPDELLNKTGVDFLNDIAGSLGGEVAFALDGPLLPTPSWKLVVEVDNPDRLQRSIEQIVGVMDVEQPGSANVSKELVNGRTFYALKGWSPVTVHYTFIDGYWLVGASRPLIMQAIQDRTAALTLPRSPEFRAQLPADGPAFFSGLFYYNMGATVGPVVDQLKATGMLTPDTQAKVDALTANRAPSLVYVYAEPNRIKAGSRSNLFQFALQALTTGNLWSGLLVPPSVVTQ